MSIPRICTVNECEKEHNAKGYCKSHYDRFLTFGDATARLKYSIFHPELCALSGCVNKYYGNEVCKIHYDRMRKGGSYNTKTVRDGKTKHPLYSTYNKMKERCYSKGCPAYNDYGGRGIKVCEDWLGKHGFSNFIKDMGDRPTPAHSLDRIDNDKGYEPSNCKWSTKAEQALNRRIFAGSMYHGVKPYKSKYKNWSVKYRKFHIGVYETLEEAISARLHAESIHNGVA